MSTHDAPDSVRAYDLPSRVTAYDSDMEIMHPLRSKMAGVLLEVLPWDPSAPLRCVDLGVGTGMLTARVLDAFPYATILAIDGAAAMVDLCRARIGPSAARVDFLVADFQSIPRDRIAPASLDVVFSAFALHHLTRPAKRDLIVRALGWLKPGGWFLNADLVVARNPRVEQRIQALRETGIVGRACGDPRFLSRESTRAYLDQLESSEHDQPLTLEDDLATARDAGLASVEVFWKEPRETVWGGPKT
jgi:tRNA (cmo5U34)-methyltransferase